MSWSRSFPGDWIGCLVSSSRTHALATQPGIMRVDPGLTIVKRET